MDGIVREAMAEGFAEAKRLVKDASVRVVLDRALQGFNGGGAPDTLSAGTARPLPDGDRADPSTARHTDGHGYYVYAVASEDHGGSRDALPDQGIDPAHPVHAVPHEGLEAIVSKVSLQEFGQDELDAKLSDITWVAGKVRAHQGILEAVLASRCLIPMRLCTIYHTEARVREMLAEHHDHFVTSLRRLRGAREWGVKVCCDHRVLSQCVAEISGTVRELRAEVAERSAGLAYFAKKKLEESTAQEIERLSDQCAQTSHDRLSGHAAEAVVCPVQSAEITGRDDEMILNGAYLVRDEQRATFEAEIESLRDAHRDMGFSYEMTGPWPPYNFVTAEPREHVADD